MSLYSIDVQVIHFFKKTAEFFARFGLFVIFFWFGLLKVLDLSPASPLVQELFQKTVPFMTFPIFFMFFGIFEMLIGILFFFRGAERVVIPLLFIHMITTFMPLFLLPDVVWSQFLVPTLEGQYIIKNLVIIAAAVSVAANLHPIKNYNHFL